MTDADPVEQIAQILARTPDPGSVLRKAEDRGRKIFEEIAEQAHKTDREQAERLQEKGPLTLRLDVTFPRCFTDRELAMLRMIASGGEEGVRIGEVYSAFPGPSASNNCWSNLQSFGLIVRFDYDAMVRATAVGMAIDATCMGAASVEDAA